MVASKNLIKIKKLCKTMGDLISEGTPPVWPIQIYENEWYLYKYFIRNLFDTIQKLKNKKSYSEIAKLFKNPTRIAEFTYLLFGLSESDLKPNEKITLALDIIELVKCYRKKDPFCRSKKNLILNQNQINKIIKSKNFVKIDKNLEKEKYKKLISRINAALFSYCEFIHSGIHQNGHEFHGPYKLKDGRLLIVREYYDLKPVEVWPFSKRFKYKNIKIFEIYSGIDIFFDYTNHLVCSKPLSDHLEAFYIILNGSKVINKIEELEILLKNINSYFQKALFSTSNFKRKDWIKKHMEMRYWYLKPLKKLFGKDWKPPKKQYDHLNKKAKLGLKEYKNSIKIKNKLYKSIVGDEK